MTNNSMIEFFVDETKKRNLRKHINKTTDKFSGLRKLLKITNILVLALPILFVLYAYFVSEGFVQLHNRYSPIGTKNHLLIVVVTIAIFVIVYFMRLIIKTMYTGLATKNLKGRFAETLHINNDILEYGYKNYMQSTLNDRVIVKISLPEIKQVVYDSNENKLTFVGKISSLYYDNYEKSITRGKEEYEDTKFELWDYFTPSLRNHLIERGINCIEK